MGFFARHELPAFRKPIPLVAKCGQCGLHKTCASPKMPPSGSGGKKILIVAEAPGEQEDRAGKQLVGVSGQLLEEALARFGIRMRKDCVLTNTLICRPPDNEIKDEKWVDYCRPNLLKTVTEMEPEVIILLGARPVQGLINWLWKDDLGSGNKKAKDAGGIGRWAGWKIPSQRMNAWICPTYHPAHVMRSENEKGGSPVRILFEKHLKAAVGLAGTRPWEKVPDWKSEVKVILSPEKAADEIRKFVDAGKPVAFDYETNMLKPDSPKARIVCASVSDGRRTVAFPWLEPAVNAMKELLLSPVPKIGYNCFSGETKFLTKEFGIVNLGSMEGRTVTVLNHLGKWVKGKVRSFGVQKTIETRFSRRNFTTTVWATEDHNWILSDGSKKATKDLYKRKYGKGKTDLVPYRVAPKKIDNENDYIEGIKHGIVLGDGTKRSNRNASFGIRLCGEKVALLDYFDGHTRSYPPSNEGDPYVYLSRQKVNLKEVPKKCSLSYLLGFVRGLLATDGSVANNGQVSPTNSSKVIEWCQRNFPRVGFTFQGCSDLSVYPKRGFKRKSGSTTKQVYFARESLTEEDFLKPSHRRKFNKTRVDRGPYKFSKRGRERIEEVFCVTVPEGGSFTLDCGLVTRNCKFEDRWTKAKLGKWVRNWVHDGMLTAHLLNNRPGVTGLKFQSFVLLGQENYDEHVRPFLESVESGGNAENRIKGVRPEDLLTYCGMDALLEFKVYEVQKLRLKKRGVGNGSMG